ncbi:MAG: hypothetical protein AAF572_00785 [Cyanobacteria bacterium P01_B01_bin.77]
MGENQDKLSLETAEVNAKDNSVTETEARVDRPEEMSDCGSDEITSQSEFDDRNPNWTEKEVLPQNSQDNDNSNEITSQLEFDDRNPNRTEKEIS